MNIGDQVNLKTGEVGTIIKIGLGDFIGDPKPITVQYVSNGKVQHTTLMSDQLKESTNG